MGTENKHLVDGKYSFLDLVDIDRLKEMLNHFSLATDFTTGIITYPDKKILFKTGHREVCDNYHKAFPISEVLCKEHNQELTSRLHQRKEISIRKCRLGLVDGAMPIIIKDVHVADLFTGQILLQEPDIVQFRKHAKKFGYDMDSYLDALKKVPVVKEETFKNALHFLSELAVMLGDLGLTEAHHRKAIQELKTSEQNLRTTLDSIVELRERYRDMAFLVESAATPIAMSTLDGKLSHVNPAFLKCWGYDSPEEVIGHSIAEFWLIADRMPEIIKRMETEGTVSEEAVAKKKDGTLINVQVSAASVHDETGKPVAWMSSSLDITEKKLAEEKLKMKSEQYYSLYEEYKVQNEELIIAKNRVVEHKRYFQSLFDQSAISIQIFNTNGLTINANKAWEDLWEAPRSHIIGNYNVLKDQSIQGTEWFEQFQKAFDGETVTLPDLEYDPADINKLGRKRAIKCLAFPLKLKGRIKQVVLMHQDITQRKEAEKELQHLRNYLSNIIDSMPSMLIGVDADGNVTQWNKIAEQTTGIDSKDAQGKPLSQIFPRMESQRERIIESIRTRQIKKEMNKPQQEKNGTHYEDITIYPLIGNEVEGAVIRIDDVSKEHKLEEQLYHSRKMDAIGQLAGGVAHDFNNMLGGIISAAQLLQSRNKNLDNRSLEYIDIILKAGTRAAELTSKLLAFGRKGKIASTALDIHLIIDETVAIFKRTIDKKITISSNQSAQNHTVIGDGSALQNAFINIGINAGHAMPNGGDLQIETKNIRLTKTYCNASPFEIEPGEYISIEIRDTGHGIPLENLHEIFEPFYTTKKQGEGTGLGLASVYGTVKDHHGAINVYSEVDVGTAFHILLPCSEESPEHQQIKPEVLTGSGLILLVDDEEIIRITGRHLLEEMGYQVILAQNGREGVEVFQKRHGELDAVIMDMIMPEMNGREAFMKMKEIDKDCTVIISSGFTKNEYLDALRKAGMAGFIRKPFRDYELSQILAKALSK